jgi:predicted neuraminidase
MNNEFPELMGRSLSVVMVSMLSLAAGEGLEHKEFIYERAPFPSCHASTLAETPGGLVVAWFGGTEEKHPDVGIWVARMEGGRWTEPVEVANGAPPAGSGEKRYPTWNPVLFQAAGGSLVLFYKLGPSPEAWWGMRMTSGDGGKTWSQPERLPDGMIGPVKNKPVALPDGSLLCGSSTEDDGWRVHFERTQDLGKTWSRTAAVHDGKAIAAIQPSILFTGGDGLLAVGRTRSGRIFRIASSDNGRSWGEMGLTNLPNPNSGTDAVTLKDGRHLLVYNHAEGSPPRWGGPRSPLNVAVSDDGVAWRAALVLEDQKGGEFSYPAVIQSADGRVHVTWTWKRERIRHAVIDPARLRPTAMPDGVWPNGVR